MKEDEGALDQEMIDRAIANLHPGERDTHTRALLDGEKDVVCPISRKVILAHQYVTRCGRKPCFYAISEMQRKQVLAKMGKHEDPPEGLLSLS